MKNLLLFFFILLTQIVFAKEILISDIDDTIRSMNTKNFFSTISNGTKTDNDFSGASLMLNIFKQEHNSDLVGYVTAGSKSFSGYYLKFLKNTHFPQDFLYFKQSNQSTYDYKVSAISKILQEEQPDSVILFGDNSSHDSEVFETINHNFPHIHSVVYIHQLYSGEDSSVIPNGHIPFLTFADLAVDLFNANLLSESGLEHVFQQVDSDIKSNPKKVIAKFFDCTDFLTHTHWPVLNQDSSESAKNTYLSIQSKVSKLCKH